MKDSWFTFGPDVLANILGGIAAGMVVGAVLWFAQASASRAQDRRTIQFQWDQLKADLVIAMGKPNAITVAITERSGRTDRLVELTVGRPIPQWADTLGKSDIRALSNLLAAIERLRIAADSVTSRTEPAIREDHTNWLAEVGRSDALELWVGAVANSLPATDMAAYLPKLTKAGEAKLQDAGMAIVAPKETAACIHSYNVEQNRVKLGYDKLMVEMGPWFQTDVTHP